VTSLSTRWEDVAGFVDYYAHVLMGSWPKHVRCDDAVQEAQVAAWRAAERWDPAGGATLASFVAHRVRGTLSDWRRRQPGGVRSVSVGADPSPVDEMDVASEDPFGAVDAELSVRAVVEGLPGPQRTVVEEVILADRSATDVAREYHVSVAAVSHMRRSALRMLACSTALFDAR
jgi:RNA polymerase sigma-70 factor (ECF subfamily)